MEVKINTIEPLLARVEEYGKTSIELLKLKSLDKTADVTSTLISRLLFMVIILIFAFSLNIAAALWLGNRLGKNYFGFLLVAAFYALIGTILFFTQHKIKIRINNLMISYLTRTLCNK